MAACAAPIYSQASGKMSAILSVSCPLSTYTEAQFRGEVANTVIECADKISKFIYV